MSQGGTKNRFFRKTPRESTGKCLISSQFIVYQNRTKTHEIRANDLVRGVYFAPPTSGHLGVPTLRERLFRYPRYTEASNPQDEVGRSPSLRAGVVNFYNHRRR